MKFPYALTDFGTLIQEGYFYQDRTDRIPQLEEAGRQLIFIRPRPSLLRRVRQEKRPLYLLIDEYDNFANEVLMTGRRQEFYEDLLYGEGVLKSLFKGVKGAVGQGIDRVFITGVSPVVLSDMTSGYNVGEDIYLKAAFNNLCGFTETEIAAVLDRLAAESGSWSPAEARDLMRIFYNGYRFSTKARPCVYNPTLSLYFLKTLQSEGEYPEQMLDENLAMDRSKLRYIAELPHGEEGIAIPQLAVRFGVAASFRRPVSRITRSPATTDG